MRITYIVGIDEAGRGPVAGPVAVGAVGAPAEFTIEHEHFKKGIKDSKKLTLRKREDLFAWVRAHDELRHSVSLVGPKVVDTSGINEAIRLAITRVLRRVIPKGHKKEEVLVLLDGGLAAPTSFIRQATIIKGDEKEPLIALASVMAKVSRDEKMRRLGERQPEYGFETHKGYGTKDHYKAIRKHGMSDSHRKSFLTRHMK